MNEYIDGPTYNREFRHEQICETDSWHKHNYDHITFVRRGAVRVHTRASEDDVWQHLGDFERGDFFTTVKGLEHRIKTLADGTIYSCVFVHREFGSDEVVHEYNGNSKAYV